MASFYISNGQNNVEPATRERELYFSCSCWLQIARCLSGRHECHSVDINLEPEKRWRTSWSRHQCRSVSPLTTQKEFITIQLILLPLFFFEIINSPFEPVLLHNDSLNWSLFHVASSYPYCTNHKLFRVHEHGRTWKHVTVIESKYLYVARGL